MHRQTKKFVFCSGKHFLVLCAAHKSPLERSSEVTAVERGEQEFSAKAGLV